MRDHFFSFCQNMFGCRVRRVGLQYSWFSVSLFSVLDHLHAFDHILYFVDAFHTHRLMCRQRPWFLQQIEQHKKFLDGCSRVLPQQFICPMLRYRGYSSHCSTSAAILPEWGRTYAHFCSPSILESMSVSRCACVDQRNSSSELSPSRPLFCLRFQSKSRRTVEPCPLFVCRHWNASMKSTHQYQLMCWCGCWRTNEPDPGRAGP